MPQRLFFLFLLLWTEYGRVLEGVPSNGFVGSRFEHVSVPSVLKTRGSECRTYRYVSTAQRLCMVLYYTVSDEIYVGTRYQP